MNRGDAIPALFVLFVVAASGCTQPKAEIKDVFIAGHGEQIYSFSYDIRESVVVPAGDEAQIRNLLANSSRLSIIFNSTNGQDNAVFEVVVFNIAAKLPTYYSYEGKLLRIDAFYYAEDGLYNASKEPDVLPNNTKLMLLGPNTGAKETSVKMSGDTITVQGTTQKNLILAGDKLALIVMGIDQQKVEQMGIR